MQTLIEVKEAELSFNGKQVLKRLNLDVKEGEVLAIIGPNGAGKSTLIDAMLGIKQLDSGRISSWTDNMRGGVGVQFQTPSFFPGLDVRDNLKLFAAVNGKCVSNHEIEDVLRHCHLLDAGNRNAYNLSGGQQKRLAIAIALIHQPALIILDEPTASLDPSARNEIKSIIAALAQQQTSVVFTSHDMNEVRKLADRIVFVRDGAVCVEGTLEALLTAYGTDDLDECYELILNGGGL